MSVEGALREGGVRLGARLALWLHAGVWLLFAGGMIAVALTSQDARENPVFFQVLAASSAAAIGAVGAAFLRAWGVALAFIGGIGVLAAWIAGDSGMDFRLPVVFLLGLLALTVAIERRAFLRNGGR
ncbi:MAG: hypothetical protein V2I27_03145 [Erythrobacter sp.]|nr:hypothetical protein [Erythrobacter sp.]